MSQLKSPSWAIASFTLIVLFGCSPSSHLHSLKGQPRDHPIEVHTYDGAVFQFHHWKYSAKGELVGFMRDPSVPEGDTMASGWVTLVIPIDSIESIYDVEEEMTAAEAIFTVAGIALCIAGIIYVFYWATRWQSLGS